MCYSAIYIALYSWNVKEISINESLGPPESFSLLPETANSGIKKKTSRLWRSKEWNCGIVKQSMRNAQGLEIPLIKTRELNCVFESKRVNVNLISSMRKAFLPAADILAEATLSGAEQG